MKNKILFTTIILFFCGISQQLKAQTDFCALMDKAVLSACKGDTISTLKNLYQLLEEHPHHKLADDIVVQIVYLNEDLGEYDEAISICKDVLKNKYLKEINNDYGDCPLIQSHKYDCRRHTLYDVDYSINQHRASMALSNIYKKKQEYDFAMHYLTLADNVYPTSTRCGTGASSHRKNLRLKYSELYEAQGKTHEAIQVLVPFIFAIGITPNEKIENRLIDLLKTNKLYTQASTEFSMAVENIEIEKVLEENEEWISNDEGIYGKVIISREYVKHGVFIFRGVKLYLPDIHSFRREKIMKEQKRVRRIPYKKIRKYQPTDEEYLAFLKQYVENSSIYKKFIR